MLYYGKNFGRSTFVSNFETFYLSEISPIFIISKCTTPMAMSMHVYTSPYNIQNEHIYTRSKRYSMPKVRLQFTAQIVSTILFPQR